MDRKYNARERRDYIAARIHTDFGWEDYQKGKNGASYRQIADSVWRAFGRPMRGDKPAIPSAAQIKSDIDKIRAWAELPSDDEKAEALELLKPENFPKWRAKAFKDPTTQLPFQTPQFQHAVFWLIYAQAKKAPIPAWVVAYINSVVPEDDYKLPENINELLLDPKRLSSFLILIAPRHGKTELVLHTMAFMYCEDKTIRVLYGNGLLTTTELMVDNIKNILETNEWLKDMYGPFQSVDYKWSKTGLRLANADPQAKALSLKPYGVSSTVVSLDADQIIADDLQDLDRASSEVQTQRDFNWLTTQLMTRREPHTGFTYVGSHLPVPTGDLFSWVEDKKEELQQGNHDIFIVKIPAHDYTRCEGGDPDPHINCVLWPELRPYTFLEAMRGLMGDDVMFEAVYNQVPRSTDMMHFPKEILRQEFYLPEPGDDGIRPVANKSEHPPGSLDRGRQWRDPVIVCCKKQALVTAMGFDPAAGKSKDSSFSAAVVKGACLHCGRRYVIDYWAERASPETHPATIIGFLEAYPQITRLRIEVNAYQAALARDPRLANVEVKYGVSIDEWHTDQRKWDPLLGIPQLGRHFKNGMQSIPYQGPGDREYAENYIKTFIRWPKTPNDIVMADWLADLSLLESIEEYRYIKSELFPGREAQTTPAHAEVTFEVDLGDPDLWDTGDYEYI